ncbi:conserved hypothetical protein [Cotesia vestalis bracovirus]|nr:conserved hypothetical protein [Cotesia vestalis bracovirus]
MYTDADRSRQRAKVDRLKDQIRSLECELNRQNCDRKRVERELDRVESDYESAKRELEVMLNDLGCIFRPQLR